MLWSPLGLILEMHFYSMFHKPSCPDCKSSKMLQHTLLPCLKAPIHSYFITPILQSLHWLQVRDRIVFKILLLIFHCLKGSAPHFNISLVHEYTPVRSLRSSNSGSLIVPKSTKTWGEWAFAHAGPTLWNKLPLFIKDSMSPDSFKSNLKTHLFNASSWLSYSLTVFVLSIVLISIFPYAPRALYRVDLALYESYELLLLLL